MRSDPATGPAGAQGAPGAQGEQGPAGPAGPSTAVAALMHGMVATSIDPGQPTTGVLPTSGTFYVTKIMAPGAFSFTNVHYIQTSAAVNPTTGANWVSVFSSAGERLANVGIDANMTGTNTPFTVPLGTTINVAAGAFVWVGWLGKADTMPGLVRCAPQSAMSANAWLAAAQYRSASNGTSLTATPESITPANNVIFGSIFLIGVS